MCVLNGLPLGIPSGKSDGVESAVRPVLDKMQTLPAFVYLVPVALQIGIGNVPGVIVTIIFALPPLASLGIRNVNPSVVEATWAFGATPGQILHKVNLVRNVFAAAEAGFCTGHIHAADGGRTARLSPP